MLAVISWWELAILAASWSVAFLGITGPRVHVYLLYLLQYLILGSGIGLLGFMLQKHELLLPESIFYTQIITMMPFFVLWVIGHTITPMWGSGYVASVDVQNKMVQINRTLVPLLFCIFLTAFFLLLLYVPTFAHIYWHYYLSFSFLTLGSFHSYISTHITRYVRECKKACS